MLGASLAPEGAAHQAGSEFRVAGSRPLAACLLASALQGPGARTGCGNPGVGTRPFPGPVAVLQARSYAKRAGKGASA